MKTKLNAIVASAAVLGAFVSLPSHAQQAATPSYNPSMYLVPGVSVFYPEDHYHEPSNGLGASLRLGKPVSESFDVQLGTAWNRAHNAGTSMRQNTLGVDALYMFSRGRLRPFLLAGVGAEYNRYNTDGTRHAGTSPYATAGLGFQAQLTDTIGVQADYRLQHGFVRNQSYGFSGANDKIYTVSLTWAFDKPAAAPAPVAVAPAPAPVVEAKPAPVVVPVVVAPTPAPAPRVESVTLSASETFALNSAKLKDGQPKLDTMADALKADQNGASVNVNGYTDRLGSDAYNMKLSQARAEAVKSYLVGKGVAAERIHAAGKGKASPVVECRQKSRAALVKCLEPNRRVEIEPVLVTRRVQN